MKETKHTPGPWRFNKQMGELWVTRSINLHLIAAAPELLAACIGALAEIEAAGLAEGVIFGEDPAICEKLHAAIAKANGNDT